MKPKIKLLGYEQAAKILSQLPKSMHDKMLVSALRASTRPMLAAARANVPVKSGRLRKMLRVVKLRYGNRPSEVAVGLKHVFDRTKSEKINEFYGKFIHEGTKERRAKKPVIAHINGYSLFLGTNRGAIKANPYLERAYTSTADQTISSFGNELDKSIGRFVARNFKPISR